MSCLLNIQNKNTTSEYYSGNFYIFVTDDNDVSILADLSKVQIIFKNGSSGKVFAKWQLKLNGDPIDAGFKPISIQSMASGRCKMILDSIDSQKAGQGEVISEVTLYKTDGTFSDGKQTKIYSSELFKFI